MMQANYPGAIVIEAENYGYGVPNRPVGLCFHTPEEKADGTPTTPGYLATTTREASYTYFVSYLAFIFQLVPESEGAYANAVIGKPYPPWANPSINLNLQTISISFEGFAANIHLTMLQGSPMWVASVRLIANIAIRRGWELPLKWTRHRDVSTQRSDPGQLNCAALVTDAEQLIRAVRQQKQEIDMPIIMLKSATPPPGDPTNASIWVLKDGLYKVGLTYPALVALDKVNRENGNRIIVTVSVPWDVLDAIPSSEPAATAQVDTAALALAVRAILRSDPLK